MSWLVIPAGSPPSPLGQGPRPYLLMGRYYGGTPTRSSVPSSQNVVNQGCAPFAPPVSSFPANWHPLLLLRKNQLCVCRSISPSRVVSGVCSCLHEGSSYASLQVPRVIGVGSGARPFSIPRVHSRPPLSTPKGAAY